MKKILAKEFLHFISLLIAILMLAAVTTMYANYKVKSTTSSMNQLELELASFNKIDQNRKILFYFSQVEKGTFLDKLFKDYKSTTLKNFANLQVFVDTLKEYNGILFISFPVLLMEKGKKKYYLKDIMYDDFENNVKYSLNIYDRKLPGRVLSDIKERV